MRDDENPTNQSCNSQRVAVLVQRWETERTQLDMNTHTIASTIRWNLHSDTRTHEQGNLVSSFPMISFVSNASREFSLADGFDNFFSPVAFLCCGRNDWLPLVISLHFLYSEKITRTKDHRPGWDRLVRRCAMMTSLTAGDQDGRHHKIIVAQTKERNIGWRSKNDGRIDGASAGLFVLFFCRNKLWT